MALIHLSEFPAYGLPKLQQITPERIIDRPLTSPHNLSTMVRRTVDTRRKEEYFEILDETIRTNPYRKAVTAMASVMSKHGIESNAGQVLGKPAGQQLGSFPEKKCALTRALKLAQNCNLKLTIIKDDLQTLCKEFGKKSVVHPRPEASGDEKSQESPPVNTDKATMTGHLVTLIGEAETIARRIYETAVGLHVAEDYLRQPEDLKLLDFSTAGRIQIPNYNFNHASQLCLEWLHSTALKWLRGFKEDGDEDNTEFIKIFENFTKAVKDYTEAVCLANQVFRVLLYPNGNGKDSLQEYILSLGHVLKNDIIMEVQSLRRAFDSIQYTFERLGWAASIAWMKYSGKTTTVETLNETGIQVDHSTFQYKFYEGPPKSKYKKKSGSNSELKKKRSNVKNVAGSASKGAIAMGDGPDNMLPSSAKPLSKKKASVMSPKESVDHDSSSIGESSVAIGAAGHEVAQKLILEQQNQGFEEVPISRRSRSTPDILKPKKLLKKKVKRVKPTEVSKMRDTVAPGGSSPSRDSVVVGKDDAPKKDAEDKMIYSHATLVGQSGRSLASSATPIPLELQQQYRAVFGPRVMAMRSVKPVAMKEKATEMKNKLRKSNADINAAHGAT